MVSAVLYTRGSKYIAASDIQKIFGISRETRRIWANEGFLTPIGADSAFYLVAAVNDFLAQQSTGFMWPPTVDDLVAQRIRLLRTPVVLKRLGISRTTLNRLIRDKHIAAIKLRNLWLVGEESVQAYAKRRGRPYFTLKQVEAILSRSHYTIWQLLAAGRLHYVRSADSGARKLVTRGSLLALLRNRLPSWIDAEDWLDDRLESSRPLLTQAQACQKLGIKNQALAVLVATQQIQVIRQLSGPRYEVSAESVDAYIEHNSKPLKIAHVATLYGIDRGYVTRWFQRGKVACPIPDHLHPADNQLFAACWIAILDRDRNKLFQPLRWYVARLVKKTSTDSTLDVRGMSRALGIRYKAVIALAESDRLPGFRTPLGAWRFSRNAVTWANSRVGSN